MNFLHFSCPDFYEFLNYWRKVLDGVINIDAEMSVRLRHDPPAYAFSLAFIIMYRNRDVEVAKERLRKMSPIFADVS